MGQPIRPLFVVSLLSFTLSANAQSEEKPHTLFGDSTEVTGGFFSFSMRYTGVFSTDAVLIGLGAGVMINHKLGIGLAGSWSSSVLKNHAYEQHLVEDGQTTDLSGLELRYGYGGLLVEPLLYHRSVVHLAMPVLIGVGGVSYSYPAPNGNNSQRNRTDGQAFFALQPGLELEVNVVGPLRIGVGGSYLYTSNIDLPATPSDCLRTFMVQMTVKVAGS